MWLLNRLTPEQYESILVEKVVNNSVQSSFQIPCHCAKELLNLFSVYKNGDFKEGKHTEVVDPLDVVDAPLVVVDTPLAIVDVSLATVDVPLANFDAPIQHDSDAMQLDEIPENKEVETVFENPEILESSNADYIEANEDEVNKDIVEKSDSFSKS